MRSFAIHYLPREERSRELEKRRVASRSLVFRKVAPISKKDTVNRLLKEAIASGAITCGDQIVEAKVARQFGVGQGLVREALLELECEGFVQRTPFSNTRIVTLSSEDAGHIFDIRIELEPFAFELAMRILVAKNDVAELRKSITQAKKAASFGDLASFFDNHLAFFRKVWELSGNKYLQHTLEGMVLPLFVLYLTRSSFTSEVLLQQAVACADSQERIFQTFLAGQVWEIKRMTADCVMQLKTMIVSNTKIFERGW